MVNPASQLLMNLIVSLSVAGSSAALFGLSSPINIMTARFIGIEAKVTKAVKVRQIPMFVTCLALILLEYLPMESSLILMLKNATTQKTIDETGSNVA